MRYTIIICFFLFFAGKLVVAQTNGLSTNFFSALELITRGDAELRLGRAEIALQHYNNAIQLAPDFAEAYIHRGRLYAAIGRTPEANTDFQHAAQLNPYAALYMDPQRRLRALITEYKSSKNDPVQAMLNNPYLPDFAYTNADRDLLAGRFDSSFYQAKIRLKQYPHDTSALTCAALSLYFLNQPQSAHQYADQLVQLTPYSPQAADIKGMILKREKHYEEAKKWFLKAIEFDSLYAISYCHMGYVYKIEGDTAAALHWLNKALTIQADLKFALLLRSEVRTAQQDYTGAKSDLAIFTDNDQVDHALYNQAVLNKHLGDYYGAMRYYESLLAKNPNDAILLNAMGNLYNFFGEYDNAVDYYSRAIAVHPDYYIARYNLGLTYLMQLRYQQACLELHEASKNGIQKADDVIRVSCGGF